MKKSKKPLMLVLSSPSGAGKTTLSKKIQQSDNSFEISVSHTTRNPRPNEVDGVDYHFVTNKKFEKLINESKFYEYAKIFENYYGTLKKSVDDMFEKNDIIFDIDWQGTKQLSQFKNLKLIKIFLIPPNKKELKQRLLRRNQDSSREVEKRFNAFDSDIKHWQDYDYVIINENLENCYRQIEKIISINKEKLIINSQTIQ